MIGPAYGAVRRAALSDGAGTSATAARVGAPRADPGAQCSSIVDERTQVHRPAPGQRVLGCDLDRLVQVGALGGYSYLAAGDTDPSAGPTRMTAQGYTTVE
jgi:hypothetical protein